tara:strand:- start:422 stop:1960 length:1539 start_codon:yes stop_codon:yes gene_type:complete
MRLIARHPNLALLALAALALAVRLALTLAHDNYLGVDGGAYLLSRNYVLGDEPTGAGFPRPILAPGLLLAPFTAALGDDVGYKVWSAVAATLPVLAVYLLSRRFLSPLAALTAAALVAFDPWQAEMLVTGALPLIGFSMLLVVFWVITAERSSGNTRRYLILVASLALIPHINQTTAGIAAVVVPVALIARVLVSGEHWRTHAPLFIASGVGAALTVAALPWYLEVAPNSSILHYPGPWMYLVPFGDIAMFQFAAALAVGVALYRTAPRPALVAQFAEFNTYLTAHVVPLRVAAVLIVTLGTMLLFLSTDETIINVFYRPRYLVMMMLWPAVVRLAVVWSPRPFRLPVNPALAAMGLAVLASAYLFTFHRQTEYSDMVTRPTADALAMLRQDAPGEGVISNAFTMSLWVAGLNKVRSPHPWTWEPPRAYTESDYHVRCVLGWVPGCDGLASSRELEVSYVLIDKRFPNYNSRAPGNYLAPPAQWEATAAAPWLELVYSRDTTRLWRVAPLAF